jgi:hypothetical protein
MCNGESWKKQSNARPIYNTREDHLFCIPTKRREQLCYKDWKEVLKMPAGACSVKNGYSK